jgi:Uma2 family endonuclease
MVAQRDDWLSVEDFLALDRENLDQKYEYIDGHMYALAGGSGNHGLIIANTHAMIHHRLKGSSCATLTEMTFKVNGVCYLPDVMVTCSEKDIEENKTYMEFPKLVIEVLSPSTEKRDRGEKFLRYINWPSVQEYVLINQEMMLVEIFTRERLEWRYRAYKHGEKVELKSIGFNFPIEEIYERVTLSPNKSFLESLYPPSSQDQGLID